jgi:hypothetical protein
VTSFGSLKEAMMSDPIPFLEQIFEAHGGLDQWRRFSKVEADIVTGGGLFPLKGLKPDVSTRRMSVWLKEERASVLPFGAPDQRTAFTPERVAIEQVDGALVAEWPYPKNNFIGHGLNTAWGPVHRAYFNGYAMWTYLNTPFLLQWEGVEVEEEDHWIEGSEVWRVLRAYLPGHIISHCALQRFYFGPDALLRRHDYHVDIAGSFAAAQLTTDYIEAGGIKLPSRRRAFAMGPDRRPIPELLMVAIDLSNVAYS